MLNDKILILSDDSQMGDFWCYALQKIGLSTVQFEPNQNILIDTLIEQAFDLALIDQNFLEFEVLPLISELRVQVAVPLLLLVSDKRETYMLEAYQLGIDECIVKPISPRLLQAKVKSWLSRSWTIPATMLDPFKIGNLQLDPVQRKYINGDGISIKLTNLEFRLLHLLMSHPGQILEANLIINRVWSYDNGSNSALLKNVIYRLRRKIEPDPKNPQYLLSAPGEGYVFYAE